MSQPILSICIPTYNRAIYIGECLDSILPQIKKYDDRVEFIISNNSSTDDTETIVQDYCKKYNVHVDYVRQVENIGSQSNFDFCVNRASGKYVFLMGDDDIYAPNLLDAIMPYLCSDKEYGIVHWNRLNGDERCNNGVINDKIVGGDGELSINDFLLRTLSSSNFMSSVIFRSEYWKLGKDFIENNWYGYRWIARLLSSAVQLKYSCLYFYFPLVIQRNPCREWSKKWPYYLIVEMSQIFEKLDKEVPGLLNKWMEKIYNPNYCDRVEITIQGIKNDIDFYRAHREDFYPFLRQKERIAFDRILDNYNPWLERARKLFCIAYWKRKCRKYLA